MTTGQTEHHYSEKKKNNNLLPIILGLLFLGAAIWGFTLMGKNGKLKNQNQNLTAELASLQTVKEQLAANVDSLTRAYEALSEENTTLQGTVEEIEKKVKARDRKLRKIRKQLEELKSSNASLSSQIQSLMATKNELEATIASLQMENDSLKTLTANLSEDLSQTKEAKAALERMNKSMNEELKRLTLSNFKATAFSVAPLLRNGKVHFRARRVRKIKVSFDLTNVPEKYQGVRPIYMVIADEKATPIPTERPIEAIIKVNGETVNIQAVEAKEINITENQRLSFTHELSQKLKRGYYRVSIYTDVGMLGAISFRLR